MTFRTTGREGENVRMAIAKPLPNVLLIKIKSIYMEIVELLLGFLCPFTVNFLHHIHQFSASILFVLLAQGLEFGVL